MRPAKLFMPFLAKYMAERALVVVLTELNVSKEISRPVSPQAPRCCACKDHLCARCFGMMKQPVCVYACHDQRKRTTIFVYQCARHLSCYRCCCFVRNVSMPYLIDGGVVYAHGRVCEAHGKAITCAPLGGRPTAMNQSIKQLTIAYCPEELLEANKQSFR